MDQQRDEGAWISEGAMRDLLSELERALEEKEELAEFRDQVLMDMTPDGLRIQLVDAENRPMFDLGSARLRSYAAEILSGLTGVLERVPNALRISGHTDARPFVGRRDYTNWELSTDRANAARRTLTASGIAPYRVAQVVGVAETQPLDPDNPMAPVNRRISIILLTPRPIRPCAARSRWHPTPCSAGSADQAASSSRWCRVASRPGSISPRSTAARTAQPGSLRC